MDAYTERAAQFVTSREFADALDINREPLAVRNRYGIGFGRSPMNNSMILGLQNARFLMARRLIECGARCVNLTWEEGGARRWDTHDDNFNALRHELLPSFDIGLSAFFDDLEARGMLDDVMVLVWGEFGRTPRINPKNGGRDHWPQVGPALLAGGGLRWGQVIGATDRTASVVVSRPVSYKDLFATIYHHLGIAPENFFLTRKLTIEKFANVEKWGEKYPIFGTPVYLEFLAGKRDLTCSAWAIPTRNILGWKGPCYLITDGHYNTFEDLMTKTPWENYGHGNDPRCEQCMVHCGYEPSAAYGVNAKFSDSFKTLSWLIS
jgi:hypothetical protein